MISASFAFMSSSILPDVVVVHLLQVLFGVLDVVLGHAVELLEAVAASVRPWRMAMRPSSASLCTTFTSSLRRCSFIAGSGTRITPPCVAGFEAEVGLANGLLDRLDLPLVERRDE